MASDLTALEAGMDKAVEALARRLSGIRTGRANPALIADLTVDYYGAKTPLCQLSSIYAEGARMLCVQVWDKAAVAAVDKAIRAADLGLNPQIAGEALRVPLPKMSAQTRQDMARKVAGEVEQARVSVRGLRREFLAGQKKLADQGGIAEDDLRQLEGKVQKMTGRFIEAVDQMGLEKAAELKDF